MYRQLFRFLLPLVFTVIVQEFSLQFLNGGMARMPAATATLASFGLAWGLTSFLVSATIQTRQLGLVLVESRYAFKKVQAFVLVFGVLLAGLQISFSAGPMGDWIVEELHGLSPPLSEVAQEALLWLIPIPLLKGLAFFYSGLLIRIRRTDIVSYATLISIGLSIAAVFVLLPLPFVQARPIWLPLLVTYLGTLIELVIIYWGHWRYVEPKLVDGDETLTFAYIMRFFWPLAFIMALQGLSRPLINLFVARGFNGAEALAVLTVVYALGHVPYGWLNEIRNLAPAFKGQQDSLAHIRRFAAGCGLVSFSVSVILFWTPLRHYILTTLIGLEAGLVGQATAPLIIFSFFSVAVTIRAYYHSIGLLEHRTRALAPSAPSRIAAILISLTVLPLLGVHGATLGVAALYSGFVFETLVVWWGVRGRHYRFGAVPSA